MRMKSAARVEEAGERRRERNRAAGGEAHRRADHDLLGDEDLEEPIGRDLLEPVAEGRVLDVGVERDDARVDAPTAASAVPHASRVATSSPSL